MHTLVLKEVKWDIGPKGTERCANKIGGGIFLSYPPLLANAVKPRGGSGENFERNPATRGLPRVGQGRHPRRIAQLLVTTGGNVGFRGHGPRDYEGDGASCPDFLASPEWPARRNLRISFLTPSPRDFHLTLGRPPDRSALPPCHRGPPHDGKTQGLKVRSDRGFIWSFGKYCFN